MGSSILCILMTLCVLMRCFRMLDETDENLSFFVGGG